MHTLQDRVQLSSVRQGSPSVWLMQRLVPRLCLQFHQRTSESLPRCSTDMCDACVEIGALLSRLYPLQQVLRQHAAFLSPPLSTVKAVTSAAAFILTYFPNYLHKLCNLQGK